MRVYFDVLGCKLNQAEAERWMREFAAAGHRVVHAPEDADVCVVHSCTVTNTASRKSRQAASQAHRRGRITVLAGCYAEIVRQRGETPAGVDLVVGTADTPRLLEVLEQWSVASGQWPVAGREAPGARRQGPEKDGRIGYPPTFNLQSPISSLQPLVPSPQPLAPSRTRAFVKVEDGCNMHCAFCIVPSTRGAERSRPVDEVTAEVRALVEDGYREVVITGVQISAYRAGSQRLGDLVGALLAETGLPRLRLSSIAPWDLDETLLALWDDPRLCRHLHLSLQSGCDATLRRMRRPYTAAEYARAVELARQRIPGVGITTDVIVGFPGETEAEFQASLAFVGEMDFTRVHVFPYSIRPGTAGATMPGQVPEPVKKERAAAMQAAGEAGARRFAARLVGEKLDALWETRGGGAWEGYTDNYVRARAPVDVVDVDGPEAERDLRNEITRVEITGLAEEGVWGRIVVSGQWPVASSE